MLPTARDVLVSRHLHPEGVETGIIAELYDDPDATHDYY